MVNHNLNNGSLLFFGFVVVALIVGAWLSPSYQKSNTESIKQVSEDAFISNAQLYGILTHENALDDYLFVDLRSNHAFELGYIPSAINIPMEELLDKKNLRKMQKVKRKSIILYAENEHEAQVARMILLSKKGMPRVYTLGGGFDHIQEYVLHTFDPAFASYRSDKARYDYSRFMPVSPGSERSSREKSPAASIPTQRTEVLSAQGGC